MFLRGQGVKRDYTKARLWFEKAAKQGSPHAQYNLGLMFYNGDGVKQNKKIAKELFRQSCDAGYQLGCTVYKKIK